MCVLLHPVYVCSLAHRCAHLGARRATNRTCAAHNDVVHLMVSSQSTTLPSATSSYIDHVAPTHSFWTDKSLLKTSSGKLKSWLLERSLIRSSRKDDDREQHGKQRQTPASTDQDLPCFDAVSVQPKNNYSCWTGGSYEVTGWFVYVTITRNKCMGTPNHEVLSRSGTKCVDLETKMAGEA